METRTRTAKPEAIYDRLVANRRTNLGVLVLFNAVMAFGFLVAVAQAEAGNALRYGVGLGVGLCGAIASLTFSVLVMRRKNHQE